MRLLQTPVAGATTAGRESFKVLKSELQAAPLEGLHLSCKQRRHGCAAEGPPPMLLQAHGGVAFSLDGRCGVLRRSGLPATRPVVEFQAGGVIDVPMCRQSPVCGWLKLEDCWWAGHFFLVITDYDYVFSENGLVAHKNGELIGTESLKTYLGDDQLKEFINFTLHYIADLDIPIKRKGFK
ncbi:hypothetical protein ACQ4PT_022399 [Festuca glaucescens]